MIGGETISQPITANHCCTLPSADLQLILHVAPLCVLGGCRRASGLETACSGGVQIGAGVVVGLMCVDLITRLLS